MAALTPERVRDALRGVLFPNFRRDIVTLGMVTDVMTQAMGGRYDGTVSFIAGPTPMVDEALRILIRVARQPATFVRYDKYT